MVFTVFRHRTAHLNHIIIILYSMLLVGLKLKGLANTVVKTNSGVVTVVAIRQICNGPIAKNLP